VTAVKTRKNTAKTFRQGALLALALLFAFTTRMFANEADINANIVIEEPPVTEVLWQEDMIANRTPTRRVNGITLRGVFPDIQPSFGPAYADINERISAAANDLINNAQQRRATTITFSYEVFATHRAVSVVMYASIEAVTTREAVRTINFNPATGEPSSLECAMGYDIAPLVERILTEWTRDNPERYYAAITAPLSAFYVTGEQLVLLFDEFQISTAAGSVGRVELTLAHIIRPRPISPAEYRIEEDIYNLKMVPIGTIARELGHYVRSNIPQGRASIYWDDSRTLPIMELALGVNSYNWGEGSQQRTLEAAPVIYGGRMLIPITFFDQIMPRTTYHVDEYGYIHFLAHRPQ
jgi:hypothetical protein